MMRWISSGVVLGVLVHVGCSGTETPGATGGQSWGGNAPAAGGSGVGGASSGGAGTSGGAASGGAASGGANVTGGTSSGGANADPAIPSEGCGLGGRPTDGVASGTNYLANFPASYDGATPLRMVVGLHAHGNPNTQIRSLTDGTRLAENFVRVFPKSEGPGWDFADDAPRLDAVLADVFSKHCVDRSRVYLTGHSSGAGMAVQMICAGDQRFAGIAPVAAWKACGSVDAIPTLYIQGIADAQRGGSDGKDVVDVFALGNACGAPSAFDIGGCTSGFNGEPVDPGCVAYEGCSEPLVWCSHDDEGYNATDGHYHGWPCFASDAMADFFLDLP